MPSEWAKKAVEKAVRKFDFSEDWNDTSVAEALDDARIEGLEEAFKLATEHCKHGEFAHYGRYECIHALRVDIRIRIRGMER